jgi:homoserine kinase
MPDSLALLDRLRGAGHAAVVSGAGPSLLVLADTEVADGHAGEITALTPSGWRVLPLEVDREGARVLPVGSSVVS